MGRFDEALLACALTALVVACGGDDDDGPMPEMTPVDVILSIAWDEEIGAVSPRHLGHNAVWSRGGLGLWDEQAGAVKADVAALVQALKPGVFRWPGGTRAMKYHFDETIGPVGERIPQCDTFTGMLDATTWGMDEALGFADGIGAEVTLVTPWHDGTPQGAAAMVAYANADPASTVVIGVDDNGRDWGTAGEWAARRVANGRAAPYGVPFLEVGNEQYLTLASGSKVCGTDRAFTQAERLENGVYIPSTARDVATQVAATARAVKAVDPAILVGAPALSDVLGTPQDPATAVSTVDAQAATGEAWNPTLAAVAGDDFDFWIVHTYSLSMEDDRVRLADELRHTVERLRTLSAHPAAVTEFGTLFDSGTMLNALLSADFVRVAVEEGLVMNLRHILIEDRPSGLFATSAAILGADHQLMPGYHAMALLAAALQPVAVPATSDDPDVKVLATRSSTYGVGVVLINRHTDGRTLTVRVPLPGSARMGSVGVAQVSALSAPALTSGLEEVTLTHMEVPAEGFVDVTLPGYGLVVVGGLGDSKP